ncbi:esterase/lipase family protein [Roseinatronobacter monicus]|nr:alpha/beta hydrolase [Roseinatronobacter monicus]
MNWLSRNEVTKIDGCMVRIQFVVWAYPYNWTNSNRMSAAGLGEVVAEAESAARAEAARLNRQAMKPILVTHSMGGLVSRAYTQILGNAGDVHGVIHGAMPTNGSPELYKRIRGGFEGATRSVLGRNQAEVTATAANMPGPLELAPNRVYQDVPGRRPWLRALDGMGNELWALPRADPYEEIYLNATDWYRLVDQTLLDPDGDAEAAWRAYRRQVNIARNFHAELEGSGFHPNTRMFYGTGRDTRDHVAWRPMERFAGAYPVNPVATFSSGRVNLRGSNPGNPTGPATFGRTLQMDGPRAQGDGTVQAGSGLHVPEMSVAVTDGFDHQKAYDSRDARELTRDWLVDMVKEAVA